MTAFWQHRSQWLVATFLFLLVTTVAPATVQAAKAPPPPVLYGITFWTLPYGDGSYINGMNNLGQVVGWCAYMDVSGDLHGFLYDPLVNPNAAIDLNALPGISGIPDGYLISSAVGINDDGVIVGTIRPQGSGWDPTVRRGFILDPSTRVVQLVPPPQASSSGYSCARINSSGDILVVYHRNDGTDGVEFRAPNGFVADPGVVLKSSDLLNVNNSTPYPQVSLQVADGSQYGAPCRWTPATGTFEWIPANRSARGINDSGTVCGEVYTKPPKGSAALYPFRYTNSLEVWAVPKVLQRIVRLWK